MKSEVIDFDAPVTIQGKSYRKDVNALYVAELEQHELDLVLDDKAWASPANLGKVQGRAPDGSKHYWHGAKSREAVTDMIHNGWPEGVARAQQLADKIKEVTPMPEIPRRRPRWAEQGDEIHMPRVWSGMLDQAWRTTKRERSRGPRVISVDVNVGHNAHVDGDSLFWSGACAVALADALEDVGYRVELFATATSVNGNKAMLSRFVVKRASDPLNVNNVAALAAHPATFRLHGLHAWARAPWDIGYGFGHACSNSQALDAAVAAGVLEGSEVQIDGALTLEQAQSALLGAVAKLDEMEQQDGWQ